MSKNESTWIGFEVHPVDQTFYELIPEANNELHLTLAYLGVGIDYEILPSIYASVVEWYCLNYEDWEVGLDVTSYKWDQFGTAAVLLVKPNVEIPRNQLERILKTESIDINKAFPFIPHITICHNKSTQEFPPPIFKFDINKLFVMHEGTKVLELQL